MESKAMEKTKGYINKGYLILYNLAQLCLWSYIAFIIAKHLCSNGISNLSLFYHNVEQPLRIAQTLAIMEVLHAGMGLVRSSWTTNAIQVLSRLHIVWLIWKLDPSTHDFLFTLTCISAWTIAEIIRYAYYVISPIYNSSLLTKIRYSGFLVLYPIGIFSEIRCVWKAMALFKKNPAYHKFPSPMPNKYNFQINLYYFYVILLLLYIPGSFFMYSHMLSQRAKILNPPKDSSKKSK